MVRDPNNPSQTKSSNPKDLLAAEEDRVQLGLIPGPALVHTALAFMDGARKYGAYNWREEGVGAMTYASAAKRHIQDWIDGEENASDSNVHHLAHAIACAMIIMDSQELGILVDNRPPPAPTAAMMERWKNGTFHDRPDDNLRGRGITDAIEFAEAILAGNDVEALLPWQREMLAWCEAQRNEITDRELELRGQIAIGNCIY